jgi:adenylate cyclase
MKTDLRYWSNYGVSIATLCFFAILSLYASFRSVHEASKESAMQQSFVRQTTRAQALLEAAVPPVIARALLRGEPSDTLTRSFDSVAVAFIILEDFDAKVSASRPEQLLSWLDDVYATFDTLLDYYHEAVNKIETVGGVYMVACGAPTAVDDHVLVLTRFCLDIMDLCRGVNGLDVNIKVGVHVGPVTAGLIGQTRRFYRLFGDTVNGTYA